MSGVAMGMFRATQAWGRHRATIGVHGRLFRALRRAVGVVRGKDIADRGKSCRVLRRTLRMPLVRMRWRVMRVMRRRQRTALVIILMAACEAMA